jgi:transposase
MINDMRRLSTRNILDIKLKWKWNEMHEKMIRKEEKEDIDWWRYQKVILLSKLISFAQKCNKKRQEVDLPSMIVQENKIPSHASKHQILVFSRHEIERLLWPENSPDLNIIESCWFWMKRRTTRKDPPTNELVAKILWERTWNELRQEKIQKWIERIPRHIAKVIELKRRNEYCENRVDVDSRTKEEKRLLQKLTKKMLNQDANTSSSVRSTSSSSLSSSSSSSEQSTLTSSSYNITRAFVTPEPPTPKSLTPPSKRKKDVSSTPKKISIESSFRIQKVIRTAASFRPKREQIWFVGRWYRLLSRNSIWYQKILITTLVFSVFALLLLHAFVLILIYLNLIRVFS